MDTTDQPNSICHVQSIHMYPLQPTDYKDIPFNLLSGESVLDYGEAVDGPIVITTYRLYIISGTKPFHIPVALIEILEMRELSTLYIGCKDARTYKCVFENNDKCQIWCDKIIKASESPRQVDQLFAFYHYIWSKEEGGEDLVTRLNNRPIYTFDKTLFKNEMNRLGFQGGPWKITKVNEDYKFCPSYPPYLLVPSSINDDILESVAKFRSSRRIPAVVWRHAKNGAVIVRSSQPEVGWLGWRSGEDEALIKAISEACNFDSLSKHTESPPKETGLSSSPDLSGSAEIVLKINQPEKKFLIMDARSYTTAIANRARGGGLEYPEYYPNCEILFMNLANIHSIRKSFHSLRQLCTSAADHATWYSQLENTRWLTHMSGLIKAAVTLVAAVENDGRPALVHCSDGWDRTPQIVALAELLLDPFYRTMEGFRILVEREWLAFGHKFADRCGHSSGSDDQNERCPVFLQWLDCVHQFLVQFPCAFEFSQIYLVKLAQHVYSNLFGTFLCNTQRERSKIVYGKTFSIWDFLNSPCFRNHLYHNLSATTYNKRVLWPLYNIRDLILWSEVYLGSVEDDNFSAEEASNYCPEMCDSPPNYMTKTRSYGDLFNDGENPADHHRRSSDPNIKCEPELTVHDGEESTTNVNAKYQLEDGDQQNMPDYGDCNQDCIFKGDNTLSDDQIAELAQTDLNEYYTPEQPNVGDPPQTFQEDQWKAVELCNEIENQELTKTEEVTCNEVIYKKCETAEVSINVQGGVLLEDNKTVETGDINQNRGESETSCTKNDDNDRLENNRVSTANGVGTFLGMERSNETSTDTLVEEGSSKPCAIDSTDNENENHQADEKDRSKNFNSPEPTTISNGWDNTLHNLSQQKNLHSYQNPLGDDGLVILRSVVQERLNQIIDENNKKVEMLERELHITRQNLIRQSRYKCNHSDCDRQDDNNSVVESVYSTSEGQASATGESLRSDISWVAVEEGSSNECPRTLWVPDHAVSRCTGCSTEFWLGRRKHHCRKCGKIFCADCSENSSPLPSEQLFNPVRVCTTCYTELQRDCTEIPNQCKQTNPQPTNANTQIAASSN